MTPGKRCSGLQSRLGPFFDLRETAICANCAAATGGRTACNVACGNFESGCLSPVEVTELAGYRWALHSSGRMLRMILAFYNASESNPLDLIEFDLIVAPVIESGGSGRLVAGHLLRDLQLAAVLQVGGDPGGAEAVGADLGS
jgi:hypothetical protein